MSHHNQVEFILGMQGWFNIHKSKNVTHHINKRKDMRCWVVQLIKHPTSAQVMILQLVSSSPTLGSVLTAQSLEFQILCPSLSAPLLLALYTHALFQK